MIKINIYLIGMSGSGKSTIGQSLADRLNMPLVDLDKKIEEGGLPINEIFEKYGEDHFRDIESQAVRDISECNGMIVSTGGGVIIREENILSMKNTGTLVYLKGSIDTIVNNLQNERAGRPLLKEGDLREKVCGLMDVRAQKYISASDVIVVTDDLTPAQIAEEIIMLLKLG